MPTTDALAIKRRDAAEQHIADYIKAIIAAAPPLTADQRDRLSLLLRTAVGGGPDAAA